MVETCGFDSHGVARQADKGFNCRVDAQNGIWGFCPTTVINAWDCGLAGFCVDEDDCKDGCGPLKDRLDITTFTCTSKSVCSFVTSDNNFGQSYLHVGCGIRALRETIYANPPTVSATITTSTSSSTQTTSSSTISSTSSLSSTSSSSGTSQTPSITPPATTSPVIQSTGAPYSPPIASATSDAESSLTPKESIPLGPIIGGVVGGTSVVCLTVLAIFFIRHRNRRASSRHSISPLRRSSSCNKPDLREEPLGAYELGRQHTQYFEASELNRDPVELPVDTVSRERNSGY